MHNGKNLGQVAINDKQNLHQDVLKSSLETMPFPSTPREGLGLNSLRITILVGVFVLLMLGVSCFFLWEYGVFRELFHASGLNEASIELGHIGPISIVILMMIAATTGLFPGAVVALTAGAVYGHTWGTVFVIIGVELGAVLAFTISRLAGYSLVQQWLGNTASQFRSGTEFTLLGMVVLSRPLAFLFPDGISFAAGLSKLSTGRFALAALVGNVPVAFLIGHFGAEWGIVQDFGKVVMVIILFATGMLIIDVPKLLKTLRGKKTAAPD
ncbi:MAG: TVP38/TMEM64 family protein [Magnetococcales bacterium]|nr:TVP38/TMEM64 family protein [Magnetococcales bacterium]